MRYKVNIEKSVLKDLRKLEPSLQNKVLAIFSSLEKSPLLGQKLSGPLSRFYSYHLKYKSTGYRVAYEIDTKNHQIIILLVDKREGFYKKLSKK